MPDIYFPKANSHTHGNGQATNQDVLRLALKHGVDLTTLSHINPKNGSRKWGGNGHHHSHLHEGYDQTVSLIKTPEDLYDVIYGGLIRDSKQGGVAARALASNMNNCRNDGEAIEVFERNTLATIAAIRDVRAKTGMETFLSIAAKRHLDNAPARAHRLLDACEAFQRKYRDSDIVHFITGFDMAGNETRFDDERNEIPIPLEQFHDVFARASRPRAKGGLGLDCSCHAGEVQGAEDVWAALRLPGIKELGHALSAVTDPKLMAEIRRRGILVDQLQVNNSMLHSDRFADPANHPLPVFYEHGLHLALGSDDPGLQDTHIGHEYDAAERKGFGPEALLAFTANAVRFGFMPPEVKIEPLRKIRDYAAAHHIPMRPDAFSIPHPDGWFMQPGFES